MTVNHYVINPMNFYKLVHVPNKDKIRGWHLPRTKRWSAGCVGVYVRRHPVAGGSPRILD